MFQLLKPTKKTRRASESVLGTMTPSLFPFRKGARAFPEGGGGAFKGGHLASISTLTSPQPWAVLNLDIFLVLLNPQRDPSKFPLAKERKSSRAKRPSITGSDPSTEGRPPADPQRLGSLDEASNTTDDPKGSFLQLKGAGPGGGPEHPTDAVTKDDQMNHAELTLNLPTDHDTVTTNDLLGPDGTVPQFQLTPPTPPGDVTERDFPREAITEATDRLAMSHGDSITPTKIIIRGRNNDPIQIKIIKAREEARQFRAGDVSLREESQKKGAAVKISGEGFSAHKAAMSECQQSQAVTPGGTVSKESSRKSSKSGLTISAKGVCKTKQTAQATSSEDNITVSGFDNLALNSIIVDFSDTLSTFVDQLRGLSPADGLDSSSLLEKMNSMIKTAWSFPKYGQELGSEMCDVLRHNGGLDILLENCKSVDEDLKFSSAKVIEQCLTTENRGYVIDKDLQSVVEVACDCAKNSDSDQSRVGTGILEHLFKHSEGTCSDIIRMGGLEAVVNKCKKKDKATLQHCAGALANLSLYGGEENHRLMMKHKAQLWLFPLAFHEDDNIRYYACLAISALVANKEIEAAVIESGTLKLVEPFVTSHLPEDFANYTDAHKHGQSKSWLKRLVPVLSSKREEARSLAAFHFCMEAGIKKKQHNLRIFREIGAIEPLKEVASSPSAIASRYAIQALALMGEEVPHKLSNQVPLWSGEDVTAWVKQIGFGPYAPAFEESNVDGDLLLRISDQNLKEDIGLSNGIMRLRFGRELRKLKKMADYSCCDGTKIYEFLSQLGSEFTEYTYPVIQAGITRDYLRFIKEEQLFDECNIYNSIHRQKIYNAILKEEPSNMSKDLDIFISYRRSNGSQLASLLKVHMTLRWFSVFIDVERLEAGKFDNNLLNSIERAKTFLLVLTQNALDRCIGDDECKDWVHREIVAALRSGCQIIPIIDDFQWPDPELLPEDMRGICKFNGVRWIHDYQEACVDKLERFMRGEVMTRGYNSGSTTYLGGMCTPGTPSTLPRAAPIYQRTTSVESGKGSSCSDKDLSKD